MSHRKHVNFYCLTSNRNMLGVRIGEGNPAWTLAHKQGLCLSKKLITWCNQFPDYFLFRYVTCGKTWVYYTLKLNRNQWSGTKKFRHQGQPKCFWVTKGIMFVDNLPNGNTMDDEYHADLIRELCKAIKEKRNTKRRLGVLGW